MKSKNFSFEPLIPYHQIKNPFPLEEIFETKAPVDVEIGSGLGEYLIKRAIDFPERNIIGIELLWERVLKTLGSIERKGALSKTGNKIKNVRLLKIDAYMAFKNVFPNGSIDNIFCLFPCPWPKKSHIKHRLFSKDFLFLINKSLKKEGSLKIVTDFYPYFEWVLQESIGAGFDIRTEKINPKYDTKFEKKWMQEGQREFFEINMFKSQDVCTEQKKEILLKNYSIKEFDPKNFLWTDLKGEDVSIILKELFFDSEQKKGMIRLVVTEQNITQHFWVSIFKQGDSWRIFKAEGQGVFPTQGIAKALRKVYEAASQINNNQ